jgi:hypothetical protein
MSRPLCGSAADEGTRGRMYRLVSLVPRHIAEMYSHLVPSSCLDDTELEFLGVPWAEYERVTNRLGIDVLRYVK